MNHVKGGHLDVHDGMAYGRAYLAGAHISCQRRCHVSTEIKKVNTQIVQILSILVVEVISFPHAHYFKEQFN